MDKQHNQQNYIHLNRYLTNESIANDQHIQGKRIFV